MHSVNHHSAACKPAMNDYERKIMLLGNKENTFIYIDHTYVGAVLILNGDVAFNIKHIG